MAISNNFYKEIFDKENYWNDLANRKLLNIYYLNGDNGLKSFYISKRTILKSEYEETNNIVIKNFLDIINNIINQIDFLTNQFRKGYKIDITSLTSLFIINQMNNNTKESHIQKEKKDLEVKKQILENLSRGYSKENQDYLYDDFPDEKGKAV